LVTAAWALERADTIHGSIQHCTIQADRLLG
jgi:hypothetical protein